MTDNHDQSKDGGNTDGRGPDVRKRRKPTPKEMRNLIAMQKLMDKAKLSTRQHRAQNEVESRTKALNESLAGRKEDSMISDDTKQLMIKCMRELSIFVAYLLSLTIISILIVLLLEPLMQLETWITALIDNGSSSYADRIVEIEHYQQRTEAFSAKIGNGILGGIAYFLFFFFWRLIKGAWIHQERKNHTSYEV